MNLSDEGTQRILIVEDDPLISKSLSLRLRQQGYDVTVSHTGLDGLNQARTDRPDLILLDLGLPGCSGQEVCKAIREDADKSLARTPIIMLTGRAEDVDRVIGHVIGADAYVTKPFRSQELLSEIEKWAGGRHEI